MPAAKKNKLLKLRTIVRKLALGLTVQQACATVGVSDEWFFGHTRAGTEHEYLRDKAEAAMIEGRLRTIRQIERTSKDDKTRLNAATWQLERIQRRQYGQDATLQLNQQINNNTLNLMDGQTLEESRRILDATKALPYRSEQNGQQGRKQDIDERS